MDELEQPSFGGPAGRLEQHVLQVDAHRDFHHSGVPQGAGKTEYRCTGAPFVTDPGEPFAAPGHDLRHVGQGFHVVYVGGLTEEPDLGWERRPETGHGAFALDGFHQRGLLPGHVGIAREGDLDVEIEPGTQDVLSQQARLLGLAYGGPAALYGAVVAMADEDVAVAGPGGVTSDDHPLHQGVRVALQDRLVVEGAGVPLFAVAEHILDWRGVTRQKAPLGGRWEGRASSPSQARGVHLLQGFAGGHFVKGFPEGPVPAVGQIMIDVEGVDVPGVSQGDTVFPSLHRVTGQVRETGGRR